MEKDRIAGLIKENMRFMHNTHTALRIVGEQVEFGKAGEGWDQVLIQASWVLDHWFSLPHRASCPER